MDQGRRSAGGAPRGVDHLAVEVVADVRVG